MVRSRYSSYFTRKTGTWIFASRTGQLAGGFWGQLGKRDLRLRSDWRQWGRNQQAVVDSDRQLETGQNGSGFAWVDGKNRKISGSVAVAFPEVSEGEHLVRTDLFFTILCFKVVFFNVQYQVNLINVFLFKIIENLFGEI